MGAFVYSIRMYASSVEHNFSRRFFILDTIAYWLSLVVFLGPGDGEWAVFLWLGLECSLDCDFEFGVFARFLSREVFMFDIILFILYKSFHHTNVTFKSTPLYKIFKK
mgnify:FL=1